MIFVLKEPDNLYEIEGGKIKTSGMSEKHVSQAWFQWTIGLLVASILVGVGVMANELANLRSTIWEMNNNMNQGFARLEIINTKLTADIQNIENELKASYDLHLATDHKSTAE